MTRKNEPEDRIAGANRCPLRSARESSDVLLLEVARGTGQFPHRHYADLGRRMREAAAAVVVLSAAAEGSQHRIQRAGRARGALRRLAAQVALAERLGYLEPTGALALLEPAAAVATALAALESRAGEAQAPRDEAKDGFGSAASTGPSSRAMPSGGTVSSATAGQAA